MYRYTDIEETCAAVCEVQYTASAPDAWATTSLSSIKMATCAHAYRAAAPPLCPCQGVLHLHGSLQAIFSSSKRGTQRVPLAFCAAHSRGRCLSAGRQSRLRSLLRLRMRRGLRLALPLSSRPCVFLCADMVREEGKVRFQLADLPAARSASMHSIPCQCEGRRHSAPSLCQDEYWFTTDMFQ